MNKPVKLFRPVVSELIWAHDGGVGTFTDRTIKQVRLALFDDQLHVGDFLGTEGDLAHLFGVSRATARSAMRELEAVGIVEIKVGSKGGVSIAPLDPTHFIDALAIQHHLMGLSEMEILDTQRAIEGMCAELAAGNATEDDLSRLVGLLDESEKLLGDPGAFTQSCQAFHGAIAHASHNRAIDAQLLALSQTVWTGPNGESHACDPGAVQAHHRSLVSLIRAGDGPGARDMMLEHLAHTHETVQPPGAT